MEFERLDLETARKEAGVVQEIAQIIIEDLFQATNSDLLAKIYQFASDYVDIEKKKDPEWYAMRMEISDKKNELGVLRKNLKNHNLRCGKKT